MHVEMSVEDTGQLPWGGFGPMTKTNHLVPFLPPPITWRGKCLLMPWQSLGTALWKILYNMWSTFHCVLCAYFVSVQYITYIRQKLSTKLLYSCIRCQFVLQPSVHLWIRSCNFMLNLQQRVRFSALFYACANDNAQIRRVGKIKGEVGLEWLPCSTWFYGVLVMCGSIHFLQH